MLEDVVRKGRLLDLYGPLLTEKQRRCMEMYFDMDLSLSEIGEELHISRQGAYDMLKRASHSLENYEQRLHLLARYDAVRDKIDEVEWLLDREEPQTLERAKQLLHEIVEVFKITYSIHIPIVVFLSFTFSVTCKFDRIALLLSIYQDLYGFF